MLIDSTRIRQKARREYDQVRRRLARAQEELTTFESKDVPLFRQWLQAAYGPILADLQQLSQAIQTTQSRIAEIQWAAHAWLCPPHLAAQRLQQGEKPGPADETESSRPGFEHNDHAGQWADDTMDEQSAREHQRRHGYDPRGAASPADGRTAAAQGSKERARRVRDIYRQIARHVHPDTRGKAMSAAVKALWLEAQNAYRQHDLEHLEMLQVRLNMETHHDRSDTQVSLLRQMTRAVKQTLKQLQSRLREQRRDPAWGFSELKDRGPLARAVGRAVRNDREGLRQQAAMLTEALRNLQQPPPPHGRRHSRQRDNPTFDWSC
ncbi:MAG: hypothetical protein K8T26_16610 [Lentisphaerae bacterium]|nr:hypothetical protein [Lentisphaerota bacterium]